MAYSSIGKVIKDLFDEKKHYDYKNNNLNIKIKSNNQIWTSTSKLSENNLNTEINVKGLVCPVSSSKIEVTSSTTPKVEFKLKNEKSINGLVVDASYVDEKAAHKCTTELGYAVSDLVTVGLKVEHTTGKNVTSANVVLKSDGYTLGGQVAASNTSNVDDYNFGFQYNKGNSIYSVVTSDKANVLTAGFHHKYSPSTLVAFGGSYNFNDSAKRNLSVSAKHTLDAQNFLQSKLSNNGDYFGLYSTKVRDWAKVVVSGQVNILKKDKPSFGVALTLGDDE